MAQLHHEEATKMELTLSRRELGLLVSRLTLSARGSELSSSNDEATTVELQLDSGLTLKVSVDRTKDV